MLRVLIVGKDEVDAKEFARTYLPPDAALTVCPEIREAVRTLRYSPALELILFCPRGPREHLLDQVRIILGAFVSSTGGVAPRFVCVLPSYQGPDVELLIEQSGARIAYE